MPFKLFFLVTLVFSSPGLWAQEVNSDNTLQRLGGVEKCLVLASPGDMLLVYELGAFNDGLKNLVAIKELLSFHGTHMKFGHAEFITELQYPGNIITHSFYPDSSKVVVDEEGSAGFAYHNQNDLKYRHSFAIHRVRSSDRIGVRDRALNTQRRHQDYWQKGVCSDYVDWLYDEPITSSWNFIPFIRRLVQFAYPFEAIQTPDDLADSPQTELVCEVVNQRLVYPLVVEEEPLVNRLENDLTSKQMVVRKHALFTLDLLRKHPPREGLIFMRDMGPERDDALKERIAHWIRSPSPIPAQLQSHFVRGSKKKSSKRELRDLDLLDPRQRQMALNYGFLAACHEAKYSLAKKLLSLGAEAHAVDDQGRSCLHFAAQQRDTEVLHRLAQWGLRSPTSRQIPYSVAQIAAAQIRWEDSAARLLDLDYYYQVKEVAEGQALTFVEEIDDDEEEDLAGEPEEMK